MKAVSFYHKDTGLLHSNQMLFSDETQVAFNTPPDHIAIEGHHDPLSKCVNIETGEVVDYQPPQPSADHEWDAAMKRWQLSAVAQAKLAAKASAVARIAELEASQHAVVRELLLGSKDARERLQEIHDNIKALGG
jgi:hypothetical protein